MTKLEPRIEFTDLGDIDVANIGLDAAEVAFQHDAGTGLTNGDGLAIVVGIVYRDGTWEELGRRHFGRNGADFDVNIDAETGKLATALQYEMDSIVANQLHGDAIPEGPQRFTGGVYYTARVKTIEKGWLTQVFGGAASGVQGQIDMATAYTALTRMGAIWTFQMEALYGKA